MPNRKQRNQPSNRIHDIEFATEISTSLLGQVRHLQTLLAEKEETLKNTDFEKAGLEAEAESFTQRLRALDESENRYKDENWNLETQIHEHIANAKEAGDREKKLTQVLNILQAEKTASQKELDEIRAAHAKLADTHAAAVKSHDVELGGLKRTIANVENEKETLAVKVQDLTGQNTELAKAITRQRALSEEQKSQSPVEDDLMVKDEDTPPDQSPPPSPVKGTPRHSHLEAETMKSSLQHAHRMIQSLKGNIHREKTEKLELKRLLQESRDELEVRRANESAAPAKKSRKASDKEFKKPFKPNQLGGPRNTKSEVSIEELQWEDNDLESSPTRPPHRVTKTKQPMPGGYESTDVYDTSNETATDAFLKANNSDDFETANEQTETEAFVTTNEGNIDSEADMTETEAANQGTIRASKMRRPDSLMQAGNRNSFNSTASMSEDEYTYGAVTTPKQNRSSGRLALRQHRGSRSSDRTINEDTFNQYASSPPSISSTNTPQRERGQPFGQSLFAELGDMHSEGEDSMMGSSYAGTPLNGRSRMNSLINTPAKIPLPPISIPPTPAEQAPRPLMVDSGVMTDAWEPLQPTPQTAVPIFGGALVGAAATEAAPQLRSRGDSDVLDRPMSDASSQYYDEQFDRLAPLGCRNNRMSMMSMLSNTSTQPGDIADRLEHFPTPPSNIEPLTISKVTSVEVEPEEPKIRMPDALSFASIASTAVEPLTPVLRPVTPVMLGFAPLNALETEAVEPVVRPRTPVKLAFASIDTRGVEPLSPVQRPATRLGVVSGGVVETEPMSPIKRPVTPPQLRHVAGGVVETEPMSPIARPITPVQFGISAVGHAHIEPISPVQKKIESPKLGVSVTEAAETEPIEPVSGKPHEDVLVTVIPGALPETLMEVPATFTMSSVQSTVDVEPIAEVRKPTELLAFVSGTVAETEPLSPVDRPQTPVTFGMSGVQSTDVEPVSPVARPVTPPQLGFVSGGAIETEPMTPVQKAMTPVKLAYSAIGSSYVEPVDPVKRPATPANLGFSTVQATGVDPVSPVRRPVTPPRPATPVIFGFSAIAAIGVEPISPPSPRPSSKRDGFFIPSNHVDEPEDESTIIHHSPETPEKPTGIFGGISRWAKEKTPVGMFIAEDDTSHLLNASPIAETPESQLPFRELSANAQETPVKKMPMTDSNAQTMLTSEQIDAMFRKKAEVRRASNTAEDAENIARLRSMSPPHRTTAAAIPGIRVRKSQDSDRRPLYRPSTAGSDIENSEGYFPTKRPESSGRRSSLNSHPPLPPNHQQVIALAAQRTGSSQSNKPVLGSMGPPLLPASAYRNTTSSHSHHSFRPRTPTSNHRVHGAASPMRNGTTPRGNRGDHGIADVFNGPPFSQVRSRASSITSFASEVESRFGLRSAGADLPGLGTGTDPRMIQAITQTMIGEYLWKYTRKAGRSELSDSRHRRYFWVHPYTRTLYWSDRDPSQGGGEMKAKSVQIEAVRVVTDNNPLPPGLHRMSLVVMTPGGKSGKGRVVKFTAATGQRHETWFNALSYLLLRGEEEPSPQESEDLVGGLTREDTNEFNPSIRSGGTGGSVAPSRRGIAASLSSYNSRTTRNESPGKAPTRPKMSYDTVSGSRASMVSRLSNYWHPRTDRRASSSRRSRRSEDHGSEVGGNSGRRGRNGGGGGSIYTASEVNDSAEDIRREMERQERESDRVENVRACCDGEFSCIFLFTTLSR